MENGTFQSAPFGNVLFPNGSKDQSCLWAREYKVRETKFHVFSVQNSENELFLILFGKICDHSIQTAPPNVSQGSNFES